MTPSNPYLPPGAEPRDADSVGTEPASAPSTPAGGAASAEPASGVPATSAGGYTPPSAASSSVPQGAPSPAAPSDAAPPVVAGASAAGGYAPPNPASTPAAQPEAPAASEVERTERREGDDVTGRHAPVRDSAPTASGQAVEAVRERKLLPVVLAGVVGIAVVALVISALLGLFAPKMSRLPEKVAGYARETTAHQGTSTTYDNATYRAGAGDVLRASIKKNAPDPAVAFNKASASTRLQVGDVYCTGVSKSGKGADCAVLLPTGSAVVVSGSTRHQAEEVASFTTALVEEMK